MINAASRGVQVRVITDEKKAKKKKSSSIMDDFLANDIVIKVNATRKMHLKIAIVDHKNYIGSYNYMKASADEKISEKWSIVFDQLWDGSEFIRWR